MSAPAKPQHRFSIWNLADYQSRSATITPEGGAPLPPPRPFVDRHRRIVHGAEIRATTHPFRGRCVLPNNVKLACTTIKVEPEWIDLVLGVKDPKFDALPLNARIGLELEFFGLIHGALFRKTSEGFSISPESAYHELLADKLAELHAEALRFEDEKSHLDRLTARITLHNPHCVYRVADAGGSTHRAKIVMLSHKLATLRTACTQRAGTRVLLGANPGRAATVLRNFESGFTVEFDAPLEELNEDMTFC